MKMRAMLLTLTILALAGLAAPAGAAEAETVPIEVTSDTMHYNPGEQEVVFKGEVHVARPDFQIWASTITIRFSGRGGADNATSFNPGEIEKIVAEQNVRLEHEGRTGTCSRAIYDVNRGMLRLEGNPVLRESKNSITGKTIRFWLDSNRSEVVGGDDQRVNAVFFAPKEIKKPQ
jgi:lipopolysaccharide export system protein LptA